MSTGAIVSVDEYLKLSCKPACEYIDGVLRQKSMPTKKHSQTQARLIRLLEDMGYEALPELTVRLSDTKYLVPDLAVGRDLEDPYPTKPILLAIEILSPDDRLGATLAKCEEYHAWGTPYCWVIDPEKQAAWEYHKGGEPERVEPRGTLHAGDIAVALSKLFA
jgi:Uma2 family endonuclease